MSPPSLLSKEEEPQSNSRGSPTATSSSSSNRSTTTTTTQPQHCSSTSSEPLNKKMKECGDLHVEAMIHPSCTVPLNDLKQEIEKFIVSIGQKSFTYNEGSIDLTKHSPPTVPIPNIIQTSCLHISLTPPPPHKSIAPWNTSSIIIHTYTLTDTPPEPEEIDGDGGNGEEPITVCETLQLPHVSLHTSWENLILGKNIKRDLLNYARSALMFSQRNVSPHIINWNRVLLLYGPPGTGKTSLCKALAHKLVIRSMDLYPSGGYLLEIKSHSLFSKWFSESGKLISKLFQRIREMVEDEPDALFVVLIDEVESLASSRVASGGGGGGDPSDAVRAVNSLLTSLDSIRRFGNVLVVSTSNITGMVDGAFVDRVDWMVKVDLPCLEARYEILRGCLGELERVEILDLGAGAGAGGNSDGDGDGDGGDSDDVVNNGKIQSFDLVVHNAKHNKIATATGAVAGAVGDVPVGSNNYTYHTHSEKLLECARLAEGLSGRALRKLPFQSHAFHVHCSPTGNVSMADFLIALKAGIERKVKGEI